MQTRIRNLPKAALLFAIAFYALVGPKILSAYSICLGSDGHIEVESSIDPCCDPTRQMPQKSAESLEDLAKTGCGPCTDISLASAEDQNVRPKVLESLDSPVLFPIHALVLFFQLDDNTKPILPAKAYPPGESNLASILTVRLLI